VRKLIYAISITKDGCCDHTKAVADEEVLDYCTQFVRDPDLLVYGGKTYQLMVPSWPEIAKKNSLRQKQRSKYLPRASIVLVSFISLHTNALEMSRFLPTCRQAHAGAAILNHPLAVNVHGRRRWFASE
jgi:hypothetical protein